MKKRFIFILAAMALGLMPSGGFAQMQFHFGVVTDESVSFSPFRWIVGFEAGFRLTGRYDSLDTHLELVPQIDMAFDRFGFTTMWLAPAFMLNYGTHVHEGRWAYTLWYVGCGITKWWQIGPDVESLPSTEVALKLHAAMSSGGGVITVFLVTPFSGLFKQMSVGLTLGF